MKYMYRCFRAHFRSDRSFYRLSLSLAEDYFFDQVIKKLVISRNLLSVHLPLSFG